MRRVEIGGEYYAPCTTDVYDKQGHKKHCYWSNDADPQLCFIRSNGYSSWLRKIPNDKWYYDWNTDTIRLK